MSTRSLIAMETEDGIEAVYCHYDGSPEHHAPILLKHYATDKSLARLINLGDLSVLGPQIGKKHNFATHNTKATEDWCLAYGRDRGEENVEKHTFVTEAQFLDHATEVWADYVYLFRDGKWLYRETRQDKAWRELE